LVKSIEIILKAASYYQKTTKDPGGHSLNLFNNLVTLLKKQRLIGIQ